MTSGESKACTNGQVLLRPVEINWHVVMEEGGFSEEVDFSLENGSLRGDDFSASSHFRQVMAEMSAGSGAETSRSRATGRCTRLSRQTSNLRDIVDGEECVFLPGTVAHHQPLVRRSRIASDDTTVKRRTSQRSLFSESGSSTLSRKISSQTLIEADDARESLYAEAASSGWQKIRRYVDDLRFQHNTSQAMTTWAFLRQHIFNLSHTDRARRDLYERYGVIPRLNNDGTYTTSNVMLSPRARTSVTRQRVATSGGYLSDPRKF